MQWNIYKLHTYKKYETVIHLKLSLTYVTKTCKFCNFISEIFDGPCTFDYLQIKDKDYSGEELGKFCGTTAPLPIVSLSNALWISMVTDGEDNRAGFRASWELKDAQPDGR